MNWQLLGIFQLQLAIFCVLIDWGTNGSWLSVCAVILLLLGIVSFAFGLLKVIKQED